MIGRRGRPCSTVDGGLGAGFIGAAIAGQFLPAVRGVAPAPAEFQIDAHRHFERDGLTAEPRDQLGLLARASPSSPSTSCICSSGTMPSRQQARIHSLVCRAAEPWISAFERRVGVGAS